MKQQPYLTRRAWRWSVLCALLILGGLLGLSSGSARASTPVDNGYRTFSFINGTTAGCNSTPTGEKPESKLWFHDGVWWGNLCHGASKTYHIYQFDLANQDWIDTGTQVDNRAATKADVLWDVSTQKLYVASAVFTTSGAATTSPSSWTRLYRYSYNSSTKRYTLDSGFPITVSKGKSETITLTKDSTGTLWVTYTEGRKVMLNHSRNGNDADWGVPYALPATGASALSSDDISSMISFGDQIGVMWSNQSTKIMYFAVHQATDANDLNWQSTNVYNPGGSGADDHINLKALQNDPAGVIFAATKTSFTGSQPLINLLVCRTFPCTSAAQWQAYMLYTGSEGDTRPIVEIDTDNRNLYVFTTGSGSGGDIRQKMTALDNIQFARGEGALFVKKSDDLKINNATSTKQYVNRTTGVLVAASSQTSLYYYHNYINLGGGPPPTPPVITSFSPTSGLVGSEVTITGSRFTGANSVKFNGTAATYVVDSDSQIRATVPAGATSGPLSVTSAQGSGVSAGNFTVTPPPNQAPTVNAGADQAVNLPNSAALAATVNDDGLPNPPAALTLTWSKSSGPGTVTFANGAAASTTATFSASGVYVLRLTANDGALSSWDELEVKVNAAPTVNAGTDQTITLPNGASLAATVSDDGLPNPPGTLTLQWSKSSGPGTATFGNAAAATTSVTFSAAGVYVLRLTANDGAVSTWDELTVTVNPAPVNQPPSVNVGSDQTVTLPSSAALAATAGDDGLPNPPAALTLQWSMTSGPGVVTFSSPNAANTTAAFSVAGVYVLRLTASDGALSAWDELTVTVNPVSPTNQPPNVNAGTDQTITLPNGATLAATVSDDGLPNPPAALTLAWSKSSGPGTVTFGDAAAASTAATFSASGVYVLRLTANDSALSSWDELTVTVNPVTPTPPVITSFSPASGVVGSVVTIVGSGFTNASAVSFNSGIAATYVVESDSQIRATVPAGAISGPLSVTTLQGSAVSAGDFIVETQPPVSGDIIFVSLGASATVGGISVRDEDILAFDGSNGSWTLYFDGSDVGLSASDVNAFEIQEDGSILLSLYTLASVGLERDATPIDILHFVPNASGGLGPNTSGTFSWFFQGGAVGLENTTNEVIDGFVLTPDGKLLLSLAGSYDLPGVIAGRDEDLILFTPVQAGDYSSGAFSLYFDGSDVGLSETTDEDVAGVWLDPASSDIYLTAKGLFSVPGLSGDSTDIFICTPGSLGSTTSCAFRVFWSGSAYGLAGTIVDGISIDKGGVQFRARITAIQGAGGQGEPQTPAPYEDDGWPDTDNWVSFPFILHRE